MCFKPPRSSYEWKIKRCYMSFNIHIFIVVNRYEKWIDVVHVNIYVLFCFAMSFTAYTNEIYSAKIVVQIYKIYKNFLDSLQVQNKII